MAIFNNFLKSGCFGVKTTRTEDQWPRTIYIIWYITQVADTKRVTARFSTAECGESVILLQVTAALPHRHRSLPHHHCSLTHRHRSLPHSHRSQCLLSLCLELVSFSHAIPSRCIWGKASTLSYKSHASTIP